MLRGYEVIPEYPRETPASIYAKLCVDLSANETILTNKSQQRFQEIKDKKVNEVKRLIENAEAGYGPLAEARLNGYLRYQYAMNADMLRYTPKRQKEIRDYVVKWFKENSGGEYHGVKVSKPSWQTNAPRSVMLTITETFVQK